jgi:hypothetical protein
VKLQIDTRENDKQKLCCQFWADRTTTDIVYGGSKGSGKSFIGCSLIFASALMYPGTHWFIARKSLTNLRKFTIPSIHEVLGIWGLSDKYHRYNGQDNYFTLHNDSRVYLLDAKYLPSDPEFYRFGSMQNTGGWIEEAGEFEEAAKNNLAASIGRWKNSEYNLPGKLLQTCNPAKNYLYPNYYQLNKAGTLPDYVKFIQALPQDNKCLPPGYLPHLERTLSKNEKERLLHGNWEFDDDPSALMDYPKIMDVFTNEHVQPGERFVSADIARLGGDRIVIIEWNGWRGKITAYSRQRIDVTTTYIQAAMTRNQTGASNVIVDEDGMGGGPVDFLRVNGFVNNSSPLPNPVTGAKENFDNLKSQCYFKLADIVNRNQLYLECDEELRPLIIGELEQVKQKILDSDMKKGVIPKEKVKEKLGRSPDFADAIMMRCYFDLKPRKIFADALY